MSDVKRCTQCGMLKEAEAFRKYTYSRENGTEGRYRVCKSCEAINTAYNRSLKNLEEFSDGHGNYSFVPSTKARFYELQGTIEKIENMYNLLEKHGLRVPKHGSKLNQVPVVAAVEQLETFYAADTTQSVRVAAPSEVPDELQQWLNADMADWHNASISPEYLQETIYESLKAKYRPQTGVDHVTFMPIYDDTYKTVLNDILRKFDDYEEECATEGSGDE